jgi:two-component system CheB/CheR fusion protein
MPMNYRPLTDWEGGMIDKVEEKSGRRVLIVEDNPDSAESLRLLLEFFGHEVWVAPTGTEGVRMASAHRPEVVLCDIGLPELDGFGVAAALRSDPTTAETHLIAITGYGSDQTRARCREVGFDRYFTKPIDPDLLVELIARAPALPA